MTVDDPATAPVVALHTVDDSVRRGRRGRSRPLAALLFVSGTTAVGLLLLAAVVAAAALVDGNRPGPGLGAVLGHAATALAALVLQVYADRRRGPLALVAAVLVLALAAATLWFWWWI